MSYEPERFQFTPAHSVSPRLPGAPGLENIEEAYGFLSRLLVAARLLAPDGAVPPPAACEALARACGCADWEAVTDALAAAQAVVRAAWGAVFGEACG